MEVIHLNKASFEKLTTQTEKAVLIDFWASWCGPCMMLAPTIDEVAEDFAGRAGVYKVNVDDEGELAARFGIMSIPTLIVFKNGEVFDKIVGVVPKENIAEVIESALK